MCRRRRHLSQFVIKLFRVEQQTTHTYMTRHRYKTSTSELRAHLTEKVNNTMTFPEYGLALQTRHASAAGGSVRPFHYY